MTHPSIPDTGEARARRTLWVAKYCHIAMLGAITAVVYYVAPHHRKVASLLAIVCVAVAFGCGYFVATYEPWAKREANR